MATRRASVKVGPGFTPQLGFVPAGCPSWLEHCLWLGRNGSAWPRLPRGLASKDVATLGLVLGVARGAHWGGAS
jgi:hypothetical protein